MHLFDHTVTPEVILPLSLSLIDHNVKNVNSNSKHISWFNQPLSISFATYLKNQHISWSTAKYTSLDILLSVLPCSHCKELSQADGVIFKMANLGMSLSC